MRTVMAADSSTINNVGTFADFSKCSHEQQSFVYKYVLQRLAELEDKLKVAAENVSIPTTYMDLIVLITDSVSKLLSLADKHETIKELMNHLLPDILKSSVTQDDKYCANQVPNRFSYICDLCDEPITIVNQDLEFSIERHYQSPRHKKTETLVEEFQTLSQRNQDTERNVSNNTNVAALSKHQIKDKIETSFTESQWNNRSLSRSKRKNDCQNTNDAASVVSNNRGTTLASKITPGFRNEDTNKTAPGVPNPQKLSTESKVSYYCTQCSLSFSCGPDFRSHLHSHKNYSQSNAQTKHNALTMNEPIYVCDIDLVVEWDDNIRYCVVCNKLFCKDSTFMLHIASNEHIQKAEQLKTMMQSMVLRLQKYAENNAGAKRDRIRYCFICDTILPTEHKCIYSIPANRRRLVVSLVKNYVQNNSIPRLRELYKIPLVEEDGFETCRLCGIMFPGKRELLDHVHELQHKSQIWQLKYFMEKAMLNCSRK